MAPPDGVRGVGPRRVPLQPLRVRAGARAVGAPHLALRAAGAGQRYHCQINTEYGPKCTNGRTR